MQVTTKALAELQQTLKPKQFMRITISAGGCQGFFENFEMTDQITDTDVIIQQKVVLDPESANLLLNSELDHVNTLAHTGFQLQVPEAQSVCGCGKSFNI